MSLIFRNMEEIIKQLMESIDEAIDGKVAEKIRAIGVRGYVLNKSMLDIDDVAVLTGLSKSHIYKLTSKRVLPCYKPNGKLMYFDKSEVEAWMRQNRIEPNEEAEQRALAYVVEKGV